MCESNETNPKWQVIFAQLHDPLNIPLLHGYLCTSWIFHIPRCWLRNCCECLSKIHQIFEGFLWPTLLLFISCQKNWLSASNPADVYVPCPVEPVKCRKVARIWNWMYRYRNLVFKGPLILLCQIISVE